MSGEARSVCRQSDAGEVKYGTGSVARTYNGNLEHGEGEFFQASSLALRDSGSV